MADNVTLPGTGVKVAADEVTYSGDLSDVQLVRIVDVTGAEGSKTVISPHAKISTANSSTAVLGAGAAFTGTSEAVSDYAAILVSVHSSHASATDGLSLQQSSDGTNWDITDVFTVPAATGKVFSVQPAAAFFRIVYTNGGTLQTTFRLQTVFHYRMPKPSSQRPQDARTNDNDFEEVLAYGMGYNGATWDRLRSRSGALNVEVDPRRVITYKGRAGTFRIPGRAGTTGQNLFSMHNATGSAVIVDLERMTVDMTATVVKAVTVLPPAIRLYRVTVLPTNGTAVTKVAQDTSLTTSASLTILQDASADGTSSGTTLTATIPAGNVIAGVFAPRLITAAGYEVLDTFTFLEGDENRITLRPLEGVVVRLDYTLATQNPVTDMWLVDCRWVEYTAA